MTDDTRASSSADVTDAEITDAKSTAEELDGPTVEWTPTPGEAVSTPSERDTGRLSGLLTPVVLVVLLIASAGFAAFIYLTQYRPDQQTDAAVATEAMAAATDGTVSLLSYTPGTLEQDFSSARARLTGDFLNYYTQFTNDIVTPAVKQKNITTTATVVRSAVADLNPDTATVVVFINQTTTSKENPDGSYTASAVKVGLVKSGDTWLISAFDPF